MTSGSKYFLYPIILALSNRDYYDFDYTSCPGNNLWSLLPEMRLDIESYKNFGPTINFTKIFQTPLIIKLKSDSMSLNKKI